MEKLRARLLANTVEEEGPLDTPCWVWTGPRAWDGRYGLIHWKGPWHHERAHRVSYEAFIGPIPEGLLVCHHCDIPCCIRPEHLFVGTAGDNIADMVSKDRHARETPRPS
jgi:hypothetical protein